MADNTNSSTSNTDDNSEKKLTPTLTINLNEEYKIKIEKSSDLGTSFFKDIYLKAAKAAVDVIRQTENNKSKKEEVFSNQEQDYNNIIAFVGERGTGKSSVMISFAKYLIDLKNNEDDIYKDVDKDYKLSQNHFESLEIIDPSLFEEGENIFEVILAQMFSKFQRKLNDNNNDKDLNQKREVLGLFEQVYENLQTIKKNGQKYDGEALETLHKLACGADLRKNFKELVTEFLKYLGSKDSKTYLIIPIDDFDLNVKAVAEMAEQIRKYLMIPKVIILMAANMEQLADAKEQNIIEHFKLLNKTKGDVVDSKLLTTQYLLKLIPYERQLKMPTASNILDSACVELKKAGIVVSSNVSVFGFIQSILLEKIGLIITKDQLLRLPILPKTLREYISFLTAINTINENSFKPDDDFTNFFTLLFVARYRIANEVLLRINQEPLERRNWFIIKYFNDDLALKAQMTLVRDELGVESDQYAGFIAICDRNNKPHNITLGDLLFYFKVVDGIVKENWIRELIQIIKLQYSISLSWFIKQQLDDCIVKLTNGGIYNSNYRQLIRGKKSHFPIRNFQKLEISGTAVMSFLGSKNAELKGVKELEWLSYFIEYTLISNYKQDATPYYKQQIDVGRGTIIKDPQFNVMQFVIAFHMPEVTFDKVFAAYFKDKTDRTVYDKIKSKALYNKIIEWKDKNRTIIPFNNLFLTEDLFEMIDNDYRSKAIDYSTYFIFLLKQIKEYLSALENQDRIFKQQEYSNIFSTNPIVDLVLKKDESIIKLLDSIKDVKEIEPEKSIKFKNLIDEIISTRTTNNNLETFVNKKMENITDDSSLKKLVRERISDFLSNGIPDRTEYKEHLTSIITSIIDKNE